MNPVSEGFKGTLAKKLPSLPLVFELCHPDVAVPLNHVENNLVSCDGDFQDAVTYVPHRPSSLREVINLKRHTSGSLGDWV